jgi:hypothetical protein
MATSKAFRTKASNLKDKRNQVTRVMTSVGNASSWGVSAIPYNRKLRHLMPKNTDLQYTKVIVLKVNSSLDQIAEEPLNSKAVEAKNMFANYRKNH